VGPVDDVATQLRDHFAGRVVAVLTDEGQAGQTCDLTGPKAFTVPEAAAMSSLETWRPQSDNPWLTFE
jgi:uncharacterized protein YbjT (DUF2867 family)